MSLTHTSQEPTNNPRGSIEPSTAAEMQRSQQTALLSFLTPGKSSSRKFTLLLRSGVFVQASISEEETQVSSFRCDAVVNFPDGSKISLTSGDLEVEDERIAFAEKLVNARALYLSRDSASFRDFDVKKISGLDAAGFHSLWEVTMASECAEVEELVLAKLNLSSNGVPVDGKLRSFRVSGTLEEALTQVDRVQDELLRARVILSSLLRDEVLECNSASRS